MKKIDRNYYIIALIAAVLFIPFLGHVHLFDWDEINFAEAAREMIRSGNYIEVQINYLPFWQKPPFFIWMDVLSMKIFGVNEFAARFPNAIIGIITLCVLYAIGKKLYSKLFGIIWVAAYAGSFLPHFYFKSALIDPTFNLLIFLSFLSISRYYDSAERKNIFLAGLFTGLAILTKGPVALIIAGGTWAIYYIIKRGNFISFLLNFSAWIASSVVIAGIWFLFIIAKNGWAFFWQFIQYQERLFFTQDAGHGGFLLYHWVILLIGVFPASIFFIQYVVNIRRVAFNPFSRLIMISFWVVLILFTIVQTKIVHYSSFCYFPITFFAARSIYERNLSGKWLTHLQRLAIVLFMGLISLAIMLLILAGSHPELIRGFIDDPFAVGNLEANIYWPSWLYLIPLLYFIVSFLLVIKKNLFFKRIAFLYTLLSFFALTALFLEVMMVTVVPRVEAFSQRAAIDFYQSKAKEDCYLQVLGFTSYAQYFYGDERPTTFHPTEEQLLKGDIDKPAYFVCKYGDEDKYLSIKGVVLLYRKNGFVFMERKPNVSK